MWPDKTFMFRLSWALLFGVLTANFLASQAKADNPFEQVVNTPSYCKYTERTSSQ